MVPVFKTRSWIVVGGLLALIVLGIVGLMLTREQNPDASGSPKQGGQHTAYVNQSLLRTARSLAATASDREERRQAQQALRLADHEVDLAFAIALREAAQQRAEPAPQARGLYDRVKKAQSTAQGDQDQIDQIKKQLAGTPALRQDAVQQRLDLAQAQFELDQDELEDAQEDLARSGADTLSRIQRQFSRYQATAQQDQNAAATPANKPEAVESSTLVGQFSLLQQLRGKTSQLRAAGQAAADAATHTRQTHDALEQQLQAQESAKQQVKQQAASQVQTGGNSGGDATSTIASLRAFAAVQKNLSDLDKRIQDEQELADTYTSWIALVQADQRAAMRRMLISALWIVVIVLLVYLACRLIDRFLVDLMQERKTLRTLRTILRFAVQAIGLLVIALIVFGVPNQMSTILGLAGAGLTVALKDFIVGFFGWFVLMGKNGIRVGDWVEINGVVGEVVEINWLRTVLLETGNWNDSGHPTGRKVAFVNSFAIEGHFFNFSTTGQWLWDELQLLVPGEQDPYPILEKIQKIVAAETAPDAQKAELEWKNATGRYRSQAVSAKPAIDLRPTALGVEVHVRYITNAGERYAMRAHLYQALVGVLHGKRAAEAAEKTTIETTQ